MGSLPDILILYLYRWQCKLAEQNEWIYFASMEKSMAKKSTSEQSNRKGFFRTLSSTFFDLPRWVSVKQYVSVNKALGARLKDSFHIAQATRQETFAAAMQRLNLTEKDLQERVVANQRGLTIMLVFIALLCLYGVYLVYSGALAGTFMILAVIALSAVRAFQYSFWNFQIKNKMLGCSFSSWLKRKSI